MSQPIPDAALNQHTAIVSTFDNGELLDLLRNRAKFEDRIAQRAAHRLAAALELLRRAHAAAPQLAAEIDALLNLSD